MKSKSSILKRLAALFLRCVFFLVAGALLIILYLSTIGFPRSVLLKLNNVMSQGDYVFEAGKVRIDLLEGLRFKKVSVYRKTVMGPPLMEAGAVLVRFDPFCCDSMRISGIEIIDGVIRPDRIRGGSGEVSSSTEVRNMELEAKNCTVAGCDIIEGSVLLKMGSEMMVLTNIYAKIGAERKATGTVTGTMVVDEKNKLLTGRIDTSFDPVCLVNLMELNNMPGTIAFTRCFEWKKGAPVAHTELEAALDGTGNYKSRSTFAMESFAYRGVTNSRCTGAVLVDFWGTNSTIEVDPMLLIRKEGSMKGKFSVFCNPELTTFDAESTIEPKAFFRMIDLFKDEEMSRWRFDGPVTVSARGTADLKTWDRTEFVANVEGRKMGFDPFMTESCSFVMTAKGITNTVSEIKGKAYGGTIGGTSEFLMAEGAVTNTRYRVGGWIAGASFVDVAKALGRSNLNEVSGNLSAKFSVTGLLEDVDFKFLTGSGSLKVEKGRVFMMPVFGSFSEWMAKIIPGVDFVLRQTDANATFTIADGKVHSPKVQIEGEILSLEGRGDYFFDGSLNFKAEVKLMKDNDIVSKLLRAITYPLSKLFEFRLKGTVSSPEWYPINFSSELLEKIGLKKAENKDELHQPDAPAPQPDP